MKRYLGLRALICTIAAVCLLYAPVAAAGSVTSNGNGFRVSPVRTDITVNPGTSESIILFIENVTNTSEHLKVVVNDFVANPDESGAPSLLLNGQNAPSHGLKRYVSLSTNTVNLSPGQQKQLSAKISIPANSSGGGYYGAVRFAPAGPGGGQQVNLSASVASLILVTVPGNYSEQLNLEGFGVAHGTSQHSIFTNSKNLQVVARFQNSGDVQEAPFGKIEVKNFHGKVIDSEELNDAQPRGNVLPDSIRRFTVGLKHIGSFGRFTVVGNFGYGSKGQLLTAKTTFYVIPLWAMVVILLIILLILFLIFGLPRLIRGYNRRVISRANRGRY